MNEAANESRHDGASTEAVFVCPNCGVNEWRVWYPVDASQDEEIRCRSCDYAIALDDREVASDEERRHTAYILSLLRTAIDDPNALDVTMEATDAEAIEAYDVCISILLGERRIGSNTVDPTGAEAGQQRGGA